MRPAYETAAATSSPHDALEALMGVEPSTLARRFRIGFGAPFLIAGALKGRRRRGVWVLFRNVPLGTDLGLACG
jgi:hypothetical protein